MCRPTDSKNILAVFGTEMGSTKNEAKKIVKTWKEKEKLSVTLLEGNDAADQFESICKTYDVIVILTSSYGDGDAPSGFGKFLYKIYEAANAGTEPLKGLEHSVLGFGSTAYYTFQNVPRLCDRLLGEAGSRRFLMRAEVDEMDDLVDNNAKVEAWSKSVSQYSKVGKKGDDDDDDDDDEKESSEHVCDWKSPKGEIYDKKLGPDGYEMGSGPSGSSGTIAICAIGITIVGYLVYSRLYSESDKEEL